MNISNPPIGQTGGVEFESLEATALREKEVIYFREVVILGGEPENGDRVYPALCQFARDVNRRERFVDAERRAAKQTDLLAGHHRHRAIPQAVEIVRRRVVSAQDAVLISQDIDDRAPNRVINTQLARRMVNASHTRRMNVELRHARKIGEKSGVQARGSRQLLGRNTVTLHRGPAFNWAGCKYSPHPLGTELQLHSMTWYS